MMKIESSRNQRTNDIVYDKGTMKVVVLACFIIVAAVLLTGVISYSITEKAVVDKVKTRDMVYIINSISSKIDGRIDRAKETSQLLATDPVILQWVAGGEKDEKLGWLAKQRITDIANYYDYRNSFIVSAITRQYWAEGFELIDVMSETDPDDAWFFETMQTGKNVDIVIDYNAERADTFVFVNALMKQGDKRLGITGIGLSLQDVAKDFQNAKVGDKSNLWLVDKYGKIHLSEDIEHNGKYLNDFLPTNIVEKISAHLSAEALQPQTLEYIDRHGETVDLAYTAAKSSDWTIVFQIPRHESVAMLSGIKTNAAVASVVSLILIIFIFYLISNRIANPFQRAIKLSREMERIVQERTHQLAETNQQIMDSIDYARRIQSSLLPATIEMQQAFSEYFVMWRPRDIVGGDFYWLRRSTDASLLAVGDCTGHGVPGALMTMVVNTILNHIVDETAWDNPALIIQKLNDGVRETIHRQQFDQLTDDGLDIALCYFGPGGRLVFASAKLSLLIWRDGEIQRLTGARKSVGCRRSSRGIDCANQEVALLEKDICYITTDGFIDQNGTGSPYSFGRKRFVQAVARIAGMSLAEQKLELESILSEYMGTEPQRDDITVIAVKISDEARGENNG